MDFDLQIAHSVEEIGQEAWDRPSGNRPLTSYRWHRFGEKVLGDGKPIYIILSRKGEAVARGTFWLREQSPLPFSSKLARRLAGAIFRRWPLLMCQSLLALASGLILPEEPPLRDAALCTIAQAAQDQAQKHHASFSIFSYLSSQEVGWSAWPGTFAKIVFPDSGTHLAIAWPDFESYVAHLSSSTRKDYRHHCREAAKLGIEVKHRKIAQPLDRATIDRASVLVQNVERHHNSIPFPMTRPTLENAHMVDALWVSAEIEGRLVGCNLILGDRDTWLMHLLGLDYDVRYVYFQLVYTVIHCAIDEGLQDLWGGGGTYELKRRLGFQFLDDNHTIFVGRGPLLQKWGRWAARMWGSQEALPHGSEK